MNSTTMQDYARQSVKNVGYALFMSSGSAGREVRQ